MSWQYFKTRSGQKDASAATADRTGGEGGPMDTREDIQVVAPEIPGSSDAAPLATQKASEESSRRTEGGRSEDQLRLESKLQEMQRTIDRLEEENLRLKHAATHHETAARTHLGRYQENRRRAQESEEYNRRLHVELALYKRKADDAEHAKLAMREEQDRTLNLLEVRTHELHHAQTFLSTSDGVPPAQLLAMVDNLNTLISQLASELTECTTFARSRLSPPLASLKEKVERWTGKTVVDTLASESYEKDSTMVQVALSAAISCLAAQLMASWDVLGNQSSSLMQKTYAKILEKEPQAISARWRALAHKSIKALDAETNIVSVKSQEIFGITEDIVRVSGGKHSQRYSSEETMKMVRDIVTLCLKIKHVVTEEIISTNLEVYYPYPGTQFSGDLMEDLDDDGSGKDKNRVPIMVTSEVGLIRCEMVEGRDGRAVKHAMLKAKVLLAPLK